MKKDNMLSFSLLGAALLVVLDQFIKRWAVQELTRVEDIRLIPGVLHLLYRENYGAAFSILQNRTVLLVGATSVVLAGMLVVLLVRKVTLPTLVFAFSLVLAGGVGNLIDRVIRGFVVDYIYFVPIDFPVFNLADCCVVTGTALIMLELLVLEPRREKRKQLEQAQEKPKEDESSPGPAHE